MVDKKLSEFSTVDKASVSDIVVLYNENSNTRNGRLPISTLDQFYDGIYLSKNDASSTYLTKTDATNTYLSKTDAGTTYLKKTDAGTTYLSKNDASNTYLSKTDAGTTYLAKNDATDTYLTKTDAGTTYLNKTDASTTYATKTEMNKKVTFNLFDHKWMDYELNDQSWLRADTFSWQDGTVYSDAYNHMVAEYNGGTSQTETVGSYTITYVLATDGHKITTDETNVANIYNESGVAWYYILDTSNQRFKLPRENPAREELATLLRAKGNQKTIGWTNGTQNFGTSTFYGTVGSMNTNAYGTDVGNTSYVSANVNSATIGLTTDSTKSGIVIDPNDSTSVYKGKQYLYFYVGQFSQSATEQTAGLNSELFNGKVDLNLNNMNPSATAKQAIVGLGMPDYSAGVDVSGYTSSSNQFTAPCNGWISMNKSIHARFYINGVEFTSPSNYDYGGDNCVIPMPKNTTYYGAANATFYPCIGG